MEEQSVKKYCKYFYYDEDRRLPCLEGCRYDKGGSPKCLHGNYELGCIYPNSREPIAPAMMPEHVRWCPGPGGCKHFNMDDYSCALKLLGKPFEYSFKLKSKSWDFTFGGKSIMIIGAVFFFTSLISSLGQGSTSFAANIFILFGFIIVLGGYFFWLWENKRVGSSIFGEIKDKGKGREINDIGSTVGVQSPTAPQPLKRDFAVGVYEGDDCPNYYYDAKKRLQCRPECKLWSESKGNCSKPYLSPYCPYPYQRKPLIPSLMPEPVGWCPGPGGCEFFNNIDYSCGLKAKGEAVEYWFILDKAQKRNRIIGIIIMIVGSLSAVLLMKFGRIMENPYVVMAETLFCIMFVMIGWVIWRWSK
ncbi:MAG: hypothetical protein HQ568_00505 [Calditrichaeota bacterium]|nr:hypothetical protein [Calditrichota bacterium]